MHNGVEDKLSLSPLLPLWSSSSPSTSHVSRTLGPQKSTMAFHLGPPSSSSHDSDSDSDELPFPKPLSREAFSDPIASFSPHSFLASLRNRHQTLEDLRSELYDRSKDLERELIELVNRDYADFIGLGSSVKGGEQRVEDLKVGLLGFKREVEEVVGSLEKTRDEVEKELRKKKEIRRQKVGFGRCGVVEVSSCADEWLREDFGEESFRTCTTD